MQNNLKFLKKSLSFLKKLPFKTDNNSHYTQYHVIIVNSKTLYIHINMACKLFQTNKVIHAP